MKFKVLRQQVSTRGGGVEIDLTPFGYENEKMTAYQNYLGGGMLGSINNDCTIRDWFGYPELTKIAEKLSMYFHKLTNPECEYEGMSFEDRQGLPLNAY